MSTPHWTAAALIAAVATSATAAQEQARVLSSIAVTQQVPVPQQYCSDQVVPAQPRTSGTGAVIGAIIGGVAGNALGGGRHYHYGRHGGYYSGPSRGATTAIGAIAGGLIGNQVENANSTPHMETVRRCTTHSGYENQVIGYDVTYEYAGRRYTTRMDHAPGPWLAINVQPQAQHHDGSSYPRFTGPHGQYQPSPYPVITNETVIYGSPPPPRYWR